MRLFYLAGMAILAFVAGDSTGDRVIVSDGFNQHRESAARTNVVSTTRLLRARSVIEEERAGGIPVSVSDKVAKFLKSSIVTDEQLQKWLSKEKTAESVFYRMNLNNPSTKYLFEDPQFTRWLKYADDLSASGKGASAISVLSAKYGDEILYLMIGRAMREQSKALGIRLQADQLKHWVKIGKDPDEVFKLYDLNYAGRRILSNSQFNAWTKYVDDLNAKSEGATVSIIPTLRKYYSDGNLIKIALAAKRSRETEAVGTKLEDAFMQFWIHRKESPVNVLVDLGLKKSTETLLESPLLTILTKYTEAYNANYPSMKTTMIETLTRTFGDEVMAKTFLAGRTKYTTRQMAKRFQTDQLEMWLNSGQSADDVYKLLNLPPRNSLVDFRDEKLFDTWLDFMNAVSIKNPDKTSAIFTTLAPTFKNRPMMQILEAANKFPSMEKAATKLQLEKAQSIFSTGVSPYTAFRIVALDNVGESVLSSPLFKKWMLYVEDFNKKNPGKEESWYLTLRIRYQSLYRVIDKAMEDPSTVKIAKFVEKEYMKEWLENWKYSPSIAFRHLDLNKAGEKVFSAPKFELWVKYLDDWNNAYPSKKETMIDGFVDSYHPLKLVPILGAAEKVPTTQKLASQLMDALVDKWVSEKKTLDYVTSWLKGVPFSDDMLKRFTTKLNSA